MSFTESIIIGLLILVVLLIAVVLFLLFKYRRIKNFSNDGVYISSDYVSREEHNKVLRERNELRGQRNNSGTSNSGNLNYYNEYLNSREEIENLKNINNELSRKINELKTRLYQNSKRGDETATQGKQERYSAPSKNGSQVILYASFPRSAGSNSYFSDLTDNLSADSYFELKVSDGTGKAVFRPLDFMKIRNYDAAMAAIVTEGVKPNVALSVVGIEPGIAHLEEKVWIIDEPAKIKLA